MPYLIYNGIDTRDLGVVIESMPAARRAERQTITATPPGYDGAIITDSGAYNNFQAGATINCFGKVTPERLFTIFSGEGWLTTSDAPTRRRYIYCYKEQTADRLRRGSIYDSVKVSFICEPYAYELTPETLTVTSGDLITGKGDVDSRPLIKLTGNGAVNLMVGQRTLLIDGLAAAKPLYIDAATKFAYIKTQTGMQSAYAAGITINMQTSASDRWPALKSSGTTAVSWTGSASVEVTPNWRWL